MISAQDTEILELVSDINNGRLLLPEMQRPYVWKAPQVSGLFDSLYRQYPSGQLLVWETDDLPYSRKTSLGDIEREERRPQLLLDGQQRLTSLAAIMLNKPLTVRGSKRPIDIVFNIHTEKFEVAGPRQQTAEGWVSLTKLYTGGIASIFKDLRFDWSWPDADKIHTRLTRLENIKTYKYRVNVVKELSYEEVTEIFVRINSGGIKLGSADLALAQISSRWRGVTEQLESYKRSVARRAYGLEIETGILLRTLAIFLTGVTRLEQLFRGEREQLSVEDLEASWKRVKHGMDQAISFLIENCKIDQPNLLPTQYILIPLAAYFEKFGKNITMEQTRDLQRWVYMALIWTRYSASAETAADQDVAALRKDAPIEAMVQNIEDKVGKRPVTERELRDQRKNSPYLLMSYLLARQANAQDWFNGVAIGPNQDLELHHIFPKKILRECYNLKTDSRIIDQVANLAFLSQKANKRISSHQPVEYLPSIELQRLQAQFVPLDVDLWSAPRFEDFLYQRRVMLADGINSLLNTLSKQPKLWTENQIEFIETRIDVIERELRDLVERRLSEAAGDDAWVIRVPQEIQKSIQHRVEEFIANNPSQPKEFESLSEKLTLCQFSDYLKIIRANWALFQDSLKKEEKLAQNLQAVTVARNALKHNRELTRADKAAAEAGLIWLEECLPLSSAPDFEETETDEESEDD